MLVLTRCVGEEIVIGDDVRLTVVVIIGNKVRIGITAPSVADVCRGEILGRAIRSYYAKQLALAAVREVYCSDPVDLDIQVIK